MNAISSESPEKLRGGYYTDPALTAFLLRWVAGCRPRTLLEPSCGDGAFFLPLTRSALVPSLERVLAWELEAAEAAQAADILQRVPDVSADLRTGDFLPWAVSQRGAPPQIDAVVGNPPFVRYQYLDEAAQRHAEALIRGSGLPFTRHVNLWVPFLVAALQRLRPGGRLGMVVPAELLHVLHAGAARQALLRGCARVLVLDLEELCFEDALQGVVLLLAEKAPSGATSPGELAIARVQNQQVLTQDPETLLQGAAWVSGADLPGKWMLALLSPRERALLVGLAATPAVHRFHELADVQVGIVTGANDFFLVPDAVVEAYDLSAWARPMFGRSEHVAGVIYDEAQHAANRHAGLPTNFLWFDAGPREALPEGAARYVAHGEAQGLHTRYKCRIREPWYRVPSVFPAPVAMLKRCHDLPRLVHNAAGALTTDTAYRVRPRGVEPAALVACFVNALTALSAELEGRHYGGGVLELVPSEIEQLLLPAPSGDRAALETLDELIRSSAGPLEVLERRDPRVLGGLGLSQAELQDLRGAWWRLRNRRQRAGSDPTGAASGRTLP